MMPIFFSLASYEIWIMIIASLVCCSCALLGCFLVLKRQALMADAISHAVLPGIVLAVILTGKLNSIWVIAGAAIVGILTPVLSDLLHSSRTLQEDSSMGIVFTTLFAIGVVLVTQVGNIDLDPDCILYGEIATAPFDTWIIEDSSNSNFSLNMGPISFWILLGIFLINLCIVLIFYKEFKLTTFDPNLANSMGFSSKVMNYLLMTMVTITTVAAFESVGAILVVAMFIAPAATAYLCTDSLAIMLVLAIFFGILSAVSGYGTTMLFDGDISIAGAISVIAGLFFAAMFLFSPKYGLITKIIQQKKQKKI